MIFSYKGHTIEFGACLGEEMLTITVSLTGSVCFQIRGPKEEGEPYQVLLTACTYPITSSHGTMRYRAGSVSVQPPIPGSR